jgi:hypothetical protein
VYIKNAGDREPEKTPSKSSHTQFIPNNGYSGSDQHMNCILSSVQETITRVDIDPETEEEEVKVPSHQCK